LRDERVLFEMQNMLALIDHGRIFFGGEGVYLFYQNGGLEDDPNVANDPLSSLGMVGFG